MSGTESPSSPNHEYVGDMAVGLAWPDGLIETRFDHSPFLPYDPDVSLYATEMGVAQPWHFTGWKDESMSWKESCYLHAGLNPTSIYRIRGPEAIDLLASICTNSFANFPVGRGKHALMCREDGLLVMHGVLLRTGEEEFVTYWLSPYVEQRLQMSGYDAVGEDLSGTVFLHQIAGPRSLEALEAATGEDLHDLAFMAHRPSTIAGRDVTVLRMGMGRTLAYEVHGRTEDARDVYAAVMQAGEPYGMRRLGWGSYMLNHTESGFPQLGWHFLAPPYDPADDSEFAVSNAAAVRLLGSLGPDIRQRYCSPVDLGWSKLIAFDHDFRGRAALEQQVADPRRTTVTLVWNSEDVVDVYASQLRAGEPYEFMEMPHQLTYFYGRPGGIPHHADQVLKGGQLVGFASGRMYSRHSREILSLGVVDVSCSEPGTEVTVLWGDPDSRKKEIRAVVAPVPYLDLTSNEEFDIESIPRPQRAA